MSKYKIGDFVLYGVSGSCEIIDIGTLSFGGKDKIYYSMKPIYDARSTIYVPVAKEDEILRKNLSKKEAEKVIEDSVKAKALKINPVREQCDPVIKSGDNIEVAKLIKMLREVRNENRKSHKGLNIQEERILQDAERVYFSEIATAFEISMEEAVKQYSEKLD